MSAQQLAGAKAPHGDNLVDLACWQATRYGEKPAYIFLEDGERLADSVTFAALDRRARALAARLEARYRPGERALLLYPSCVEYMVTFFGCLYAGIVAVPVFAPRNSKHNARLVSIRRDCDARLALTTAKRLAEMGPLPTTDPELRQLDWIASDEDDGEHETDWVRPAVSADTVAFLQYTSGSTGDPKGVIVSHGNLLFNQAMLSQGFATGADSTYVTWLPIYHDMGLIGHMLQAFYCGASCVFMSPVSFLQRPIRWLRAISDFRGRVGGGPNFGYELCAQKITGGQMAGLDLSSWRVALNGAEPVRRATLERFSSAFAPWGFRKQTFYPCYGMAEATLIVSGGLADALPIYRWVDTAQLGRGLAVERAASAPNARALVGVGATLQAQRIAIVDPDTLCRCPDGEVGEIWVAGEHVARGYWNRPEESRETFCARIAESGEEPFLRTGDLGFMRRGELFITGRLKDVIIVRGFNHYPQDIELTVEESSPALRSGGTVAFGISDETDDRVAVVAEVERTQMRKIDPAKLALDIRRTVLEQHDLALSDVVLIRPGTLPKTSSGKVQRRRCRELYLSGQLDRCHGREAREQQLSELEA